MLDVLQLSDHLFVSSTLAQPLEAVINAATEAMLDASIARRVLLARTSDDIAPQLDRTVSIAVVYCIQGSWLEW